MRSDDPKVAVRRRLKALMEIILDEAAQNPEFLIKLDSLLGHRGDGYSDALDARSSGSKRVPGPNLLEVLHSSGESVLRDELESMTTDQLARTAVQEGVRKSKEAKALVRGELVELMIETTKNRLRQGESFVRRGA